MNPMGRVPVLIDGAACMFESAAILRYLGAAYGSEDFWPSDPSVRGPLDTWAEWGKNTFAEAVLDIFVYDVRTRPEARNPDILERATRHLIPLAQILADRVGAGPWIAGETFTFADIACGHILHRYFTLDWARPDLPALATYYQRLQGRPAYRAHAMVSYEVLRGSY
jgi:glutathione S-transferase